MAEGSSAHQHAVTLTIDDTLSELNVEPCEDLTYGAAADLDTWDEGAWAHTHHLATYRDRGQFETAGADLPVKLIGYGGPATLFLALPPLRPGRYRVRKRFILPGEPSPHREGMIAAVEFEVGASSSA
ncbi:MAG: hypothetical protein QOG87_3878 [Actinomycetota bacterium]